MHFDKKQMTEQQITKYRKWIHVAFALLYLLVIIAFRPFHKESLIDMVFDIAGFTYGPLLGLYSFGLFIKRRRSLDKAVPFIAVASPIICFLLKYYAVFAGLEKYVSSEWLKSFIANYSQNGLFSGYKFGFEILIINGLFTFLALLAFSKKEKSVEK